MQDFLTHFYEQILSTSLLEWIATVTGFLCVYLAAKQNILNWPISIISVGCFMYLFYDNKLYGDALLQIYFLSTAIYGWFYWKKMEQADTRPIRVISAPQMLVLVLVILVLTIVLGMMLQHYTDTDVPYMDAFCTSISFVAQYLMTRKVLQNWLLWVIVDICYVPLYAYKELYMTSILYIAFAIIAFNGYFSWRTTYRNS